MYRTRSLWTGYCYSVHYKVLTACAYSVHRLHLLCVIIDWSYLSHPEVQLSVTGHTEEGIRECHERSLTTGRSHEMGICEGVWVGGQNLVERVSLLICIIV